MKPPLDPELILAYVEDELPDEQRAAVARQLATQPAYAAMIDAIIDDRQQLRGDPAPASPFDLTDAALAGGERQMLFDDAATLRPDARAPVHRFRLAPLLTYGGIAAVLGVTAAVVFQSLQGPTVPGRVTEDRLAMETPPPGVGIAEAPLAAQRALKAPTDSAADLLDEAEPAVDARAGGGGAIGDDGFLTNPPATAADPTPENGEENRYRNESGPTLQTADAMAADRARSNAEADTADAAVASRSTRPSLREMRRDDADTMADAELPEPSAIPAPAAPAATSPASDALPGAAGPAAGPGPAAASAIGLPTPGTAAELANPPTTADSSDTPPAAGRLRLSVPTAQPAATRALIACLIEQAPPELAFNKPPTAPTVPPTPTRPDAEVRDSSSEVAPGSADGSAAVSSTPARAAPSDPQDVWRLQLTPSQLADLLRGLRVAGHRPTLDTDAPEALPAPAATRWSTAAELPLPVIIELQPWSLLRPTPAAGPSPSITPLSPLPSNTPATPGGERPTGLPTVDPAPEGQPSQPGDPAPPASPPSFSAASSAEPSTPGTR